MLFERTVSLGKRGLRASSCLPPFAGAFRTFAMAEHQPNADDTLVQYICVLRKKDLKWPTGAFVAQGAHGA